MPETTERETWQGLRSLLPQNLQEALSSDLAPSSDVLQAARAFRDDPSVFDNAAKKRLDAIDEQIEALQNEKDRLADEDTARAAVVEACAAICSPMRRIHGDVVLEIARHAMATYPFWRKTEAPLNLSHVSRVWRDAVIHAPHLWTDLYLRIHKLEYNHLVQYADIAHAWFRRAGSLPINLYIYVDCDIVGASEVVEYNLGVLLNSFTPWAPQISRLGLGARGPAMKDLMVQCADIQWKLETLHTLEILGTRCSDPDLLDYETSDWLIDVASRIKLFHSAPELTTLIAHQEMTYEFATFSFIPWAKLTTIALMESLSSREELSTLFENCPRLESASLSWNVDTSNAMMVQPPPLGVAHLRRLSLELRSLSGFFQSFTFPNLTYLEIWIVRSEAINNAGVQHGGDLLLPGVVGSFPALTNLWLECILPVPQIIHFLQNTPKLQVLGMTYSGSAAKLEELFRSMIIEVRADNQSIGLVPCLAECEIEIHDGPILLDTAAIAQFACSRIRDSPMNSTLLNNITLTGNYRFLRDLHEEVARIAGVIPPNVTIRATPGWQGNSAVRDACCIIYPSCYFAGPNDDSYGKTVHHEFWLNADSW